MADAVPVVHIGENSPEEIAFKLLHLVGKAQQKGLTSVIPSTDKTWILDTYAECLFAVRGHRVIPKP